MDFSEILNIVIPILLTSVIIPLILGAGEYIKKKAKTEMQQKYFAFACDAVVTAVAETMQTFVTTMKNNGTWTDESAKQALEMSKLKAQEIMGVAALNALPEIVGDVETWLTSKVEAATLTTKQVLVVSTNIINGVTPITTV